MACHTNPGGKDYGGGYVISSPLGDIIASNISPSKTYGIGNWSEGQFAKAVREGVAPEGNLYPAMPYTAYSGISDADIHALYVYFMKGTKPVDEAPVKKTNLPFPFSQRWLMAGWNVLYASGKPMPAATTQEGAPSAVSIWSTCWLIVRLVTHRVTLPCLKTRAAFSAVRTSGVARTKYHLGSCQWHWRME